MAIEIKHDEINGKTFSLAEMERVINDMYIRRNQRRMEVHFVTEAGLLAFSKALLEHFEDSFRKHKHYHRKTKKKK